MSDGKFKLTDCTQLVYDALGLKMNKEKIKIYDIMIKMYKKLGNSNKRFYFLYIKGDSRIGAFKATAKKAADFARKGNLFGIKKRMIIIKGEEQIKEFFQKNNNRLAIVAFNGGVHAAFLLIRNGKGYLFEAHWIEEINPFGSSDMIDKLKTSYKTAVIMFIN